MLKVPNNDLRKDFRSQPKYRITWKPKGLKGDTDAYLQF